jgi:myo-inositol 2-dehydrogenase/D-chiro-inositol 1-dehydrogenase/scyllo-inositol 2-dehydrogenase (NAD+)
VSGLEVLIVGAGRAGAVHAVNLAENTPRASVAGVVDANLDSARQLAGRIGAGYAAGSLEEALERGGFDAVVITAPTFAHRDLAVAAAGAGKHVFCEKPMALDAAECDAMIGAARTAGVTLQIGFMRRVQPEFAEAHRRIQAGDIGQPMVVKSLTRGPGLPPAWAWSLERSNGMLAEVNSHDFDCVRWLVGSDIERVYAEVANLKGPSRGVEHADFYDNAVVTLRFASGAVGTIDGTCPADYGYDARVEILGTEGLLVIGDVRGQALLEVRDRDHGGRQPVHRTWPERFEPAYRAEMRGFVEACLDGTPPIAGGEDGRAAVLAVVAGNRSWQEGRPVELRSVETAGTAA